MDQENLIIELRKRMTLANRKENARKMSRVVKPKTILSGQDSINLNYISNTEYAELYEFYRFLRANKDATNEEIEEILKRRYVNFEFLSKLYKKIPNMITTLKEKGPLHIALEYVNKCLIEENKRIRYI